MLLFLAFAVSAQADAPPAQQSASPVLGSKGLMGQYGKGWGRVAPRTIFNGGVPSGLIKKIRWRRWGKANAYGFGLTYLYKPQGGYYDQPGGIRLRATRLGSCSGKRAYTKLYVRTVNRPGGSYGRRHSWSETDSLCL